MTELFLKFKLRKHLETKQKLDEIVTKYSLAVEDSFETRGRPDPTINVVLAVKMGNLSEVRLALKRVPEILVTEK